MSPAHDYLTLLRKTLPFVLSFLLRTTLNRLSALIHKYTYTPTSTAKIIVVVGGSFSGLQTVRRLCDTLPSGYKILWIEQNSHLNYVFAFPRFSVVPGFENRAFIPYTGVESRAPRGILSRVQGVVEGVDIHKRIVRLDDGSEARFECLVLATGSKRSIPSQVASVERDDACAELRGIQDLVKESQSIAIVGAGAVGVELAGDIKDVYPEKEVTLVHSRERILSRFGERLGSYALRVLRDELGVRVLLNERPDVPDAKGGLVRDAKLGFRDGSEEMFDLVIPCTGQTPNSSILSSSSPDTVSANGQVLVGPTLQVITPTSTTPSPDSTLNRIFALGDVAAHGGPLMARAGFMQAEIVVSNILSLIKGKEPRVIYQPNWFLEGAIKLTLGREHNVIYGCEKDGRNEALIVSRSGRVDLDVGRAWREFGADIKSIGS